MTYHPLLAVLLSIPLTVSPLCTVYADTLVDQAPSSMVSLAPSSTEVAVVPLDSFSEPVPIIPTSTIATSSLVEAVPHTVITPAVQIPSSTMLCLAIIEPAPIQGPEWIALYGLTPSTTASLLGWSLADALGTMMKVGNTNPILWDESTQTARIELKSSRLNNDGDTVAIKNPLGIVHDSFIYPSVEKGERWMRDSCTSTWRIFPERVTPPDPTNTPVIPTSSEPIEDTPLATTTITAVTEEGPPSEPTVVDQVLPSPPVLESISATATLPMIDLTVDPLPTDPVDAMLFEQPPEGVIDDAVAEAAELLDIAPVIATVTPIVTATSLPVKNEPIIHSTPPKAVVEKKVPLKKTTVAATPIKTTTAATPKKSPVIKAPDKKTTVHKKTTKKSTVINTVNSITSLSMSPLISDPESYQGIRVRIRGRVTSDKNILGAHRFVITNSDGRGLLIHATSKQVSPPIGALVDVTGKVVWNDEGLWIQQSTTDRWIPVMNDEEKGSSPNIHHPNLHAPSQEDAWSLLRTEGVVTDVQRSSFDLEVNGASVHVRVSNLLGYRVGRLQKDDQVTVAGLLDLRGNDPTIIPQATDAIVITERAKFIAPVGQAPVSRPWLPVGAAASTLGLSEGWRRLRDRQKRRREEASFQAHKAAYQIQN